MNFWQLWLPFEIGDTYWQERYIQCRYLRITQIYSIIVTHRRSIGGWPDTLVSWRILTTNSSTYLRHVTTLMLYLGDWTMMMEQETMNK